MIWVDAHAHLHSPWFPPNSLQELLDSAERVGIKYIVNCGSELRNYQEVIGSSKHEMIYYTLGVQPTVARNMRDTDFIELFGMYKDNDSAGKFVGIGEVGLDYYWVKDEKTRKIQQEVFLNIITAANALDMNLILHTRKAESEAIDMVAKYADVQILLHSFDGNLAVATQALELGYKITVPTNLTIRRNRRKTAKRFGIDNLLLETDAPFCAPAEDIKRNESKYIPIAAEKMAQYLELPLSLVAEQTTKNAIDFYNLPHV